MDIICTNCCEPWEVDYVLHEAKPGEFKRVNGVITSCPACKGKKVELSNKEEIKCEVASALGEINNDVDGLAADLEDFDMFF